MINHMCLVKILCLISVFVVGLSSDSFSQTVVLKENVSDTISSDKGPNKKHYTHFYLGYDWVAGKSAPGAQVNYLTSGGFSYGLRYKRKISHIFAMGFDIGYHGTNYFIKQSMTKSFPDSNRHKEESLNYGAVRLGLYGRVNFNKNRGDHMGKYFDLGVAYERNLYITHVTIDNMVNGTEVETITRKLKFVNKNALFGYGRLGFNRYLIKGGYRISELFTKSNYQDLPKWQVGIEIGFY